MASSSTTPLVDNGQDQLSDYIPQSNEISRLPTPSAAPSAAPSVSAAKDEEDELEEEEPEEEEEEDEAYDEDGDADMKASPAKGSAKKTSAKKAAKMQLNDKLDSRRKSQASLKSADSIKRFTYLLGQTDLFKHFCDLKAARDPSFAAMLEEASNAGKGKKRGRQAGGGARGRRSEKDEDAELLKQEGGEAGEGEGEGPFMFTESPAYVKGGKMREYQIQGLNWMCGLHYNGINGILADEMGLGKTLQTISFLGYLKFIRGITGPHLIVVPKSTLDNWAREIDRWVPGFRTVVLKGTKEERQELLQQRILPGDFDILLASYEICLREKAPLRKLSWEYIIIDEAHRIKNVDSMLSQIVRLFDSRGRLLITGTPLQNNLHELWALLNFLLPDVFSDVADFDAWFASKGPAPKTETSEGETAAEAIEPSTEDPAAAAAAEDESSNAVVKQLHAVLRPFLLRRVKMDVEKSLLPKKEINVYVGMTELQRKWYKSILEKDIDAVNGVSGKKEGKTRLQNIVMQLRKCCNHPYLFDGAEPGPPFTTDEHLVEAAGKMLVLDKLLKSMKAKGSRVLIFSQMSRVLDILEDFCLFREYQYCRLDGGTAHEDRMEQIDAFNQPGSEKFIFLLTTRAGGLGINLVTADVVVLYDSDWNPQADLQAMDRAHRIGQTKQVYVFRFVTENAVEEKVLERAAQKLRLDQLVIQQGRAQQNIKAPNKDDLVDMIQHGADKIIDSSVRMTVDDDIDAIISRGEEKTQALNSKFSSLNFDQLQIFNNAPAGTTTQWEGEEYGGRKKPGTLGNMLWIEPTKRERKQTGSYHFDGYYSGKMGTGGGPGRPPGRRGPRGPRRVAVDDFKFFPPRLQEIQEKEQLYFRKTKGEQAKLREDPTASAEDLEAERQEEQDLIDNAEPLNDEEKEEKEELKHLGFDSWTKREFQAFMRGMETYGRKNFEGIHRELTTKTIDEIKEYSEVFWDRYQEIEEHERLIAKLEAAEYKAAHNDKIVDLIKRKMAETPYPLQQMKIIYANQTKGKSFSEDEDRFLLVEIAKYGIANKEDTWERIKRDVNEWPAFRFDWFMKSRTPTEIGRRCDTLIKLIGKEFGLEKDPDAPVKPRGRARKSTTNADGTAPATGAKGKRKAAGAVAVGGDDAASNVSGSRASTPAGPAAKKAKTTK
ncbi:hypothetical protein JCM11251_007878 [Rhodosporidiobolus azoricus]